MKTKDSLWDIAKEETAADFSLLAFADFKEGAALCFLLTGETLGRGDEKIGSMLLMDLLETMVAQKIYPKTVILVNGAVKLITKENPAAAVLKELEIRGSAVFASDKSAEAYRLGNEIDEVYLASTARILTLLCQADKVITL